MPPARVSHFAREPHFSTPVAKDLYGVSQPLSSIAGTRLFSALSPMSNHTGVAITPLTAMQSSAVYGCVRCLAEDWAKLPLRVYAAQPDGTWQADRRHPLAALMERPNRWQTLFAFISYLSVCLSLRGNAFIFVLRGADGRPQQLIPISPDRCQVMFSRGGWLYYEISHPAFKDNTSLRVHQDDMLHIRNISLDGFMGVSPIAAAAEAMGLSLATQQHGAVLFRQGTQASGVLKHPGSLSQPAQDRIRDNWQSRYGGVENAAKVLVLEEGMAFEKLSMTSDEAQFLETRKFQVEEICRFFRVPPHMVQSLDRATFSNIENQGQQYIDQSLIPPCLQFEQEAAHALLFDDERGRYRLGFDFDGLLRGDMKSRFDSYHVALGDGWMTPNQVCRREGMPTFEGGDDHRVALNTAPAGSPAADAPPPA